MLDTEEDHIRWGVEIKPSKLLNNQELGLYARHSFKTGAKIAPYLGEEITLKQRKERYGDKWGPYVYYKPWGHPSIDAMFYRGAAAFANDGSWIPHSDGGYHRRDPDLSNVRLERGWLKAIRNIQSGDELLLNYGESYWMGGRNSPITSLQGIQSTHTLLRETQSTQPPLQKTQITQIPIWGTHNQICDYQLISKLTPVVEIKKGGAGGILGSPIWIKRDDLFEIHGVRGGKARSCLLYICNNLGKLEERISRGNGGNGVIGVVTGGSRSSPQVQIVGQIAHHLGLKARLHLPQGDLPTYIKKSTIDLGHEVFQWFPGFNHVISARVKEDVKHLNGLVGDKSPQKVPNRGELPQGGIWGGFAPPWLEIPFGMEFSEAVQCTAQQVTNLPFQSIKRILLPVGSGMTLVGILTGLKQLGMTQIPIVGIVVGKDPTGTLNKWISWDWTQMVTFIRSPLDYHQQSTVTTWHGIPFDPIYEAKIIPFIQPLDLIWLVGHR